MGMTFDLLLILKLTKDIVYFVEQIMFHSTSVTCICLFTFEIKCVYCCGILMSLLYSSSRKRTD